MSQTYDELSITMEVPLSASALERDGMLKRMEDAVGWAISEIPNGYIMSSEATAEKLRVDVEAAGLTASTVLVAVADGLAALLEQPDVAGWGPYGIEAREANDAAGSAQEFQARLVQSAGFVQAHLDSAALTALDTTSEQPDERAQALVEADLVAGALFHACIAIVDYLFEDLESLLDEGASATVASARSAEFFALDELPSRYRHKYGITFTKQFLVSAVCVTERFTSGWAALSCLADELVLRLILNQAEVQLEAAEASVTPGWRGVLEDALFEDTDHEMLYEPEMDGIEDEPEILESISAAPMAFSDWFAAFNAERSLPPYLLDDAEFLDDDEFEDRATPTGPAAETDAKPEDDATPED